MNLPGSPPLTELSKTVLEDLGKNLPDYCRKLVAGTDVEEDAPILWATVKWLEPKRIVELGTRDGFSTRIIANAMLSEAEFITVDPVDCRENVAEIERCSFWHMLGEEAFDLYEGKADFIFIDTDPHTTLQTINWLESWVSKKLSDNGIVAFHDYYTYGGVKRALYWWFNIHPEFQRISFKTISGLILVYRNAS